MEVSILKSAILLMACSASWALTSCGDEAEGRIEIDDAAPAKVTDVQATAGPGELYLSWTNPSSSSYMYTKLVYLNSRGEERKVYVSKDHADASGRMTTTLSGFVSTDPVTVSLYACSVRGNSTDPVQISYSPGAPAFAAVAESVTIEPAYGGAMISYSNTTTGTVYLSVEYQGQTTAEAAGEISLTVAGETSESQFIAFNYDENSFINGEATKVTVYGKDVEDNSSDPFTFTVTPKRVVALDKTVMSFPGYDDSSNDAQTGYSSQEAGGEGATPNGRVIAMLDDNLSTFWHTAWKTSSAYPHFFILDLGQDANVVNLDLRRRTGNSGTMKGLTIYACTEADATGGSDGWGWVDQGWHSFDPTINNTQRFLLETAPETTRYIKCYFATDDANGNYVMISNLEVYVPAE